MVATAAAEFLTQPYTTKTRTHPDGYVLVLVGDGGFVTTNFPHRCGKWTAVVNGGSSPNRKRFRTTAAAAFLISTISDQNKGIPQGHAFILVGDGGFGPPKSATTDLQSAPFGHSGNLPYDEVTLCELIGAGDRSRTNNLLITNQLLCH